MQSLQGPSFPNYGATPVQYIYLREDSSSATASDLIGPSRILGKVFSLLGAKLERRINLAADRFGYGPQALRRKLSEEYYCLWWAMRNMPVEERKRMIGKLMSYVRSGTSITQSQALELICDLILQDLNLAIRDEFLDAGLYAELQNLWLYCDMAQKRYQYLARRDPDIDFLLASSRKALIFVEENEVHTVAKRLLSLKEEEILSKPYPDRLDMLSTLLHVYAILIRQYLKETRNTPIGTLAYAYWEKIDVTPWFTLLSFYNGDMRPDSLVTPLPTEKIELCIRAYFLLYLRVIRADRAFVRHCTLKSLTEERKLRYYSMVQMNSADNYNGPQGPDIWDDIPLPTLPDKYSNVEMELISTTKSLVDLSKLDKLRFSLPMGFDRTISHDHNPDNTHDSAGWVQTAGFLTVWETSSES